MKNLNTDVELTTMIKQYEDLQKHVVNSKAKIESKNDRKIITFIEENQEGSFYIRFDLLDTNEVLLNRESQDRQSMSDFLFKKNKKTAAYYKTMYGVINLTCHTKEIIIENGALKIEYQLFEQEKLVGEYKLQLIFGV